MAKKSGKINTAGLLLPLAHGLSLVDGDRGAFFDHPEDAGSKGNRHGLVGDPRKKGVASRVLEYPGVQH